MKSSPCLLSATLVATLLTGCAIALIPPTYKQTVPISDFRYIEVEPTATMNSFLSDGVSISNRQVNPSKLIEGILLKRGLVQSVPNTQANPQNTLLVRWGISGRRNVNLLGAYTQEVSIALLQKSTSTIVFSCTAEGIGSTEAEDIQNAIANCLSAIQ